MMLVLFTVPFGWLQGVFLDGFTVAKFSIPLLFIYIFFIRSGYVLIPSILTYYVLFIIATLPSLLTGVNYLGILSSFFGYILLFILVYNDVTSIQVLRKLLLSYVLGLGIVSFLVSFSYFTGVDFGEKIGRPFVEVWFGNPIFLGTATNPNGFATLFIVGIPTAFMFFLTVRSYVQKICFAVLIGVLAFTLVMTLSRSGIAGALIGCLLLCYYSYYRNIFSMRFFSLTLLVAVVILSSYSLYFLVLGFISSGEGVNNNRILVNKEVSIENRLVMLENIFSIIASNPLVGVGYGNLAALFEDKIGLRVGAHNIFFGIAAEYGLIALFFFCAVLFFSFRMMVNTIAKTVEKTDRLTLGCIFSILTGLLFHGLFHEIYVNIMLWFCIAIGAAARRISDQGNRA